ncbi:MAG: DUF3955 domain-containing protein [Calditrichaeota bacterium]|nr:MAG: DUF3955 domain-containing protein [Calditrichota bacterium]
MKKINYVPIILIGLGLCCFVAFNIIGSEIAPDGTLIEPFALVPIGFIFIFKGILFGVVLFVWGWFRKRQN